MAHAFHDGERAVQARAGAAAIAQRNAAVIADRVIPGARAFIEKQALAAVAARAPDGALWASLLFGRPGFLSSPAGQHIEIRTPAAQRDPDDPFWAQMQAGAPVGMLFIELATRRRYRVNGRVSAHDEHALQVDVAEAYPNCPKYIQRRHLSGVAEGGVGSATLGHGKLLDTTAQALLAQADTLFMASGAPGGALDASHRGGPPGFIEVLGATRLRVPDYAGNGLFNSLGNLALDPACGLVVPDFAGRRLLHLSGHATLLWDQPDPQGRTGGTGRFWEFELQAWRLRELPAALQWEFLDASPFNPTPTA